MEFVLKEFLSGGLPDLPQGVCFKSLSVRSTTWLIRHGGLFLKSFCLENYLTYIRNIVLKDFLSGRIPDLQGEYVFIDYSADYCNCQEDYLTYKGSMF